MQKRQISSFYRVMKWMDIWPVHDKTKTQCCHLKQKKEHACRDVCVFCLCLYCIFEDFLTLRTTTQKTHLSPAETSDQTHYITPYDFMRVPDTNPDTFKTLQISMLLLLTRAPPTPPHAALTYTDRSQQPAMSCPEFSEHKKKGKTHGGLWPWKHSAVNASRGPPPPDTAHLDTRPAARWQQPCQTDREEGRERQRGGDG